MRHSTLLAIVFGLVSASASVLPGCATDATVDEFTTTAADTTVAGKVELVQATDGSYSFRVRSGASTILLTSDSYATRSGAIGGVLATLAVGDAATNYQVEQDAHGYLTELLSSSGTILASTKVYASQASAKRAMSTAVRALSLYLDKRASGTGARFEVNADSSSATFSVFNSSGVEVLTSDTYASEGSAYNAAYSLQDGVTYVVYQDNQGGWSYDVHATGNNATLATSPSYKTSTAARAARDAVKTLLGKIQPF
jgi:uncharacterized protein YegP (UPF0339 family)